MQEARHIDFKVCRIFCANVRAVYRCLTENNSVIPLGFCYNRDEKVEIGEKETVWERWQSAP